MRLGVLRLTVIHNPVAGGRRHLLPQVLAALERRGATISLFATAGPGDAKTLVTSLPLADSDRLVVAGGDGTINEAVNGLGKLEAPPPLAIVPLGTANVLAVEIGLRRRAAIIANTILDGPVRDIPLGLINGRRFVLMAGIGFDARAVARVNPALKRLFGKAAYVISSLQVLARFNIPPFEIEADGTTYRAASAVVANVSHYGGGWRITDRAGLDRDGLVLCLFEQGGRLAAIRYALALLQRRLDRTPGFRTVPVAAVRVAGPAGEPVQVDGDVMAELPITVTAAPERLALVYPPA